MLSYENKLQIKTEIILHSQLDHKNIIKFYDWFKEGDHIFIVLEYAEGGTLFKYLDFNHKLPTDLIRRFVFQTCLGLIYLHDIGVVHRDIKPENLLLDKDLNIKLCDFGLCIHVAKIKGS